MAVSVFVAGCATDPAKLAGKLVAKPVARTIVQALPPPKPKIVVVTKGGSFCTVMKALRWPYVPSSDAEIDAMSDRNAAMIQDTNDQFASCPKEEATPE